MSKRTISMHDSKTVLIYFRNILLTSGNRWEQYFPYMDFTI